MRIEQTEIPPDGYVYVGSLHCRSCEKVEHGKNGTPMCKTATYQTCQRSRKKHCML